MSISHGTRPPAGPASPHAARLDAAAAVRSATTLADDAELTREDIQEVVAAQLGSLRVPFYGVSLLRSSSRSTNARGFLTLRLPRMKEATWSLDAPPPHPGRITLAVPDDEVAYPRNRGPRCPVCSKTHPPHSARCICTHVKEGDDNLYALLQAALDAHERSHGPLLAEVEYGPHDLPGAPWGSWGEASSGVIAHEADVPADALTSAAKRV